MKNSPATTEPSLFDEDYEALRFEGLLAGVDEAGRGPLAGPVCAAAVILDPKRPIEGLADSKKLSAKKREALAPLIRERALAWAVAWAEPEEIDRVNILRATMNAMRRAVEGLGVEPDCVWVDGNRLPDLPYPAEAIVKGDAKSPRSRPRRFSPRPPETRRCANMRSSIPNTASSVTRATGRRSTWRRSRSSVPRPFTAKPSSP